MSSHKNGAAVLDKNKGYRPSEKEPFMNERQREYFRDKLLAWKEEILKEARETLAHLQAENDVVMQPDAAALLHDEHRGALLAAGIAARRLAGLERRYEP